MQTEDRGQKWTTHAHHCKQVIAEDSHRHIASADYTWETEVGGGATQCLASQAQLTKIWQIVCTISQISCKAGRLLAGFDSQSASGAPPQPSFHRDLKINDQGNRFHIVWTPCCDFVKGHMELSASGTMLSSQ